MEVKTLKSKKKYSKKYKSKLPSNNVKITNNNYKQKTKKSRWVIGNAYIDDKGNYQQKPHFANFWKEGFLTDIPTRKDYNRIMDGIVHTDSMFDRSHFRTEEEYRRAIKQEENDALYGLERMQISINRLWNGSIREWLKLFVHILIPILTVIGLFGLFDMLVGTTFFG